jgi:hypothetical protein
LRSSRRNEDEIFLSARYQWGSAWRQRDYDVVNSPEFKKALQDNKIILIKWRDLQKLVQQ